MLRFAGQFLAIVAMMASAINAQCELSCSLQEAHRNTGHATLGIHPSGDHACCPEGKAPASRGRDQRQRPCPILLMTTTGQTNLIQYSNVTQLFDEPAFVAFHASLPLRDNASSGIVDSAGIPDIPAFAILRI